MINGLRYQTLQFLYDQGSELFRLHGSARAEAKTRGVQRPLSVQVIQREDGEYIEMYINGQRFVPDTKEEFHVR